MVYKLAEEDKLCGVIYPTYDGFSPIPKATCEMLESKCDKTEIIVKCVDEQTEKEHTEENPQSASVSTSESTSTSTSVSESTSESSSTSESTSESQASTSESTSTSTSTSDSTSESTSVSDSNSTSTSTSVSNSSSESTSTSESTSESTSTESTSESTSTESTSTSESTSVSESTTESTTTSTSTSVSTSESASSSTENSNTPEEPKPTPEPQPEPVPTPVLTDEEITGLLYGRAFPVNKKLGNVESDAITEINTSVTEPTPEEVEDFKNTVINLTGDIEELKGYNVEVILKKREEDYPKVGEKGNQSLYTYTYKVTKPNGDVYTSEENTIPSNTSEVTQYDKLLPNVETFSKVIAKDGQVVEVPEVTEEEKTAYENKVIEELKKKLPEGTTVEAKLEGAKYNKGDEIIAGKTNYDLKVKITKNDVVYEHTYKVPHTEEAPHEEPEAPEVDIDEKLNNIVNKLVFEFGIINRDYNNRVIEINDNNYNNVTPEILKTQEKVIEAKIKEALGDKVHDVKVDLTQLINVGTLMSPNSYTTSAFEAIATVTKSDGTSVTLRPLITTAVVDSL